MFLVLFVSAASAQSLTYSKVQITFQDRQQMNALARQGVVLDHGAYEKLPDGRVSVSGVLNEREISLLKDSGVDYQILVPDVVAAYDKRPKPGAAQIDAYNRSDDLQHFELGSMGGYYTYDEVVAELDSMHLLYPNLTTAKQSLGQSIEGREIWMIKISDNPQTDETDEPEVFYNALHHAREPAGMMTLMYFMDYLLEKYGSDPQATYLVDHREMYFVPVVNPDGYVYNQQTDPNGGGQWRKNRRENQGGYYGVDLNRNYGYKWGYDDNGSSPYPFSDTYRGAGPFSEPETQAIRDFCNGRHFAMSLSYHTYSDLLIYPWAYEDNILTPDSAVYFDYGDRLTQSNHYCYGNTGQTVGYAVNGSSDDWFYGEQSDKQKIIAFTPEVGNDADGFWPPESRIYPLAQENLPANLLFAWLAGGKIAQRDFQIVADDDGDGYAERNEQVKLVFKLQNIGRGAAQDVQLSLETADPYVHVLDGQAAAALNLDSWQTTWSDTFLLQVSADAPAGYSPELRLAYDMGGAVLYDTVRTLILGEPQILFSDDAAQGMTQWSSAGWDTTSADYASAGFSFTDSPQGSYAANSDNSMTLANALALPTADRILLEFKARWRIEHVYDFATVEASTDGTNWQALAGQHTLNGSGKGVQPADEPGYDGLQMEWIKEQVDITSYAGQANFYLRFRLQSDGGMQKDGWYVDDIQLLSYQGQPSSLAGEPAAQAPEISDVLIYPNPFNQRTVVSFNLERRQRVVVAIFNVRGQLVKTLYRGALRGGRQRLFWDGRNASGATVGSGLYVCRIHTQNSVFFRKLLLIK